MPGKRVAWNKGRTTPVETRARIAAKLSIINRGANNSQFGKKRSAEARARQSAAVSGANNPFFGRTHSAESRAKNRASHKGTPRPTVRGKPRPPEVRAAIAAALKRYKRSPEHEAALKAVDRRGEANPSYGKPKSQHVRDKISASLKRRFRSPGHARPRGSASPAFGRIPSVETRQKISARVRRHWEEVRVGLRDAFRARGLQVSYDDRASGYVAATPQTPDSVVLQRERKRVVRDSLVGLALREKRVVNAVFFEGKSLDVVAKAEGLTREETETLLSVVLAKLRRQPRLRAVMG